MSDSTILGLHYSMEGQECSKISEKFQSRPNFGNARHGVARVAALSSGFVLDAAFVLVWTLVLDLCLKDRLAWHNHTPSGPEIVVFQGYGIV